MDLKDYIPDTAVVDELCIEPKTIWEHDQNPKSDFPKKIKIGHRNYRLRSEFEAYKLKLADKEAERRKAMARRKSGITT